MIFAKCSNSRNDKCYPHQSIILPALHYLFCSNYVYFATKKGLLAFIFSCLGFLFVWFLNYYYFLFGFGFLFLYLDYILLGHTHTKSGVPVLFSHLFPAYFHPFSVVLKTIQDAREFNTLLLIPWGYFRSQS